MSSLQPSSQDRDRLGVFVEADGIHQRSVDVEGDPPWRASNLATMTPTEAELIASNSDGILERA